jgi:mono/diheme cytochrome c family protein
LIDMDKHLHPTHLLLVAMVLIMTGCLGDSQSPGLEYMPDMYRGPAIEAYVDYGQDPYHYGEEHAAEQRLRPSARVPAQGTIPYSADPAKAMYNMPYAIENSEEGYAASAQQRGPIAMTEATVERGKILYEVFCDHCHGATGGGDGPVVERGGHPPPGAFNGPLRDRTEGQIFHVITYGRGVMGPHAPLLNKEERWFVTQYVKFLQNDGQMPGGQAPEGGATPAADGAAGQQTAAAPATVGQ